MTPLAALDPGVRRDDGGKGEGIDQRHPKLARCLLEWLRTMEQFRMTRWALAFSILAAGLAAPACAATDGAGFEDLDKLEARVVAALDAGIGTPGGPLTHIDRRVKLQPCPVAVTIEPPALGAVAVSCPALGWRIRVPLMHLPTQVAYSTVPATYQPPVPLGPPVIRRGDPVEVAAEQTGFSVTASGTAMEDGRTGGRIRVRTSANPNTPFIVGEVVDSGRVRVTSF
jgi:flagella basal body P-ring formation protein FlgA